MPEVIDSLVTQLEFSANTKVIAEAEKKLKQLEKQSKAAANEADNLSRRQEALKDKLIGTAEAGQKLKRKQQSLREETRKLHKEEKQLTKEIARNGVATRKQALRLAEVQKRSRSGNRALNATEEQLKKNTREAQRFNNSLKRLGVQQAKLGRQRRGIAGQQKELGGALSKAGSGGGLSGIAAAAGPIGAAFTAAAAGAAVFVRTLTTVIETGARMESLRARLKTVEGGTKAAAEAFGLLRQFAKTTPFELEDVTNAYVRLKSLGLKPTADQLKAFGNVAAAQGKPIMDFVEAVGDAATGEFERLKEFGIKASSQGEQVAFTFGGVTTKIRKNSKEITAFLKGLGETKFAGAMADQMNTFNGVLSNLKDTWTGFLDQVAQLGVLDEAKLLIQDLAGTMGDDLAQTIADVLIGGLRMLREIFAEMQGDGNGLSETFKSLVEIGKLLFTVMQQMAGNSGNALKELQDLITVVGKLVEILNIATDVLSVMTGDVMEATDGWSLFGDTFAEVGSIGEGVLGTVLDTTRALTEQSTILSGLADDIKRVQDISKQGLAGFSDSDLQDMRREGGKKGARAEQEIRKRIEERTKTEKNEESASKRAEFEGKKKARAGDVAKDFSRLSDRQLGAFTTDPNISQKLREKAEKEQLKRDKSKRKKGGAAGKKLRDATLFAQVEKQITKTSREIAQAEAARALRAGTVKPGDLAAFETERFKARKEKLTTQFEKTGELPAGIAADVRQIAALPSINDLAGRTAQPVISITNNLFNVNGNTFTAEVTGEFATTPLEVAEMSTAQFERLLFRSLGDAQPGFATQENR